MDEQITPPEKPQRRKLSLTKAQRQELIEQKKIEHVVALFLDLEQDRTVQQIADETGMSLSALKRLTQTPTFQDVYDNAMLTVGHHPRMLALQAGLPELIPLAHRALRRLLSPGTAHTAQVAAVKLLFDTLDVAGQQAPDDPTQLNNFLAQNGVQVDGDLVVNVNLPIPKDYQAAFERLMGREHKDSTFVEGSIRDNSEPPRSPRLSSDQPDEPFDE